MNHSLNAEWPVNYVTPWWLYFPAYVILTSKDWGLAELGKGCFSRDHVNEKGAFILEVYGILQSEGSNMAFHS